MYCIYQIKNVEERVFACLYVCVCGYGSSGSSSEVTPKSILFGS